MKKVFYAVPVILSIFLLAILLKNSIASFANISDLPSYYAAGKLALKGDGAASYIWPKIGEEEHNLFPAMGERIVPLLQPPFGLTLISVLGLLNVQIAPLAWKIFLVACLIIGIFLLRATYSLDYKKTCYLIIAICLSYTCYESLRIDQLTTILFLALSAAIYFLTRNENKNTNDIKAGLCFSLLLLKPHHALPLLMYLAGLRRWRVVITFFAILLLCTFIAYLGIGNSGFLNYLAFMHSPESLLAMQAHLSTTLRGQLLLLFPSAANVILGFALFVYALILGFAYRYGRRNEHKNNAIQLGILAVLPLGLIGSPFCHSYDLLLLAPTFIVIFTDLVLPFSEYFKSILIFAGLIFMLPLAIIIHYQYLLNGGYLNPWFIELLILAIVLACRTKFFSSGQERK